MLVAAPADVPGLYDLDVVDHRGIVGLQLRDLTLGELWHLAWRGYDPFLPQGLPDNPALFARAAS